MVGRHQAPQKAGTRKASGSSDCSLQREPDVTLLGAPKLKHTHPSGVAFYLTLCLMSGATDCFGLLEREPENLGVPFNQPQTLPSRSPPPGFRRRERVISRASARPARPPGAATWPRAAANAPTPRIGSDRSAGKESLAGEASESRG